MDTQMGADNNKVIQHPHHWKTDGLKQQSGSVPTPLERNTDRWMKTTWFIIHTI